jgi:hypothetical protein
MGMVDTVPPPGRYPDVKVWPSNGSWANYIWCAAKLVVLALWFAFLLGFLGRFIYLIIGS